jgi:hypothetical protein
MGRIGEPITGTVRDEWTILLVMLHCILNEISYWRQAADLHCVIFCSSEPAVSRLVLADSAVLTRSSLSCLTFVIITKFWRSLFSFEIHAYANGQFQPNWRLWTLSLKLQSTKWKQDRYKRKLGDGQTMIILYCVQLAQNYEYINVFLLFFRILTLSPKNWVSNIHM